jgi:tRNA(Ile)-lysidine synthase TilS/MesJ
LFYNTNTQINSDKLAYGLFKDLNNAFYQFKMIQDRDRIAVAVPGGKECLTFLSLLDPHYSKVKEN